MSYNGFPAGVDRLPGEELIECPRCGAVIDPLRRPYLTYCPCTTDCSVCGTEWGGEDAECPACAALEAVRDDENE